MTISIMHKILAVSYLLHCNHVHSLDMFYILTKINGDDYCLADGYPKYLKFSIIDAGSNTFTLQHDDKYWVQWQSTAGTGKDIGDNERQIKLDGDSSATGDVFYWSGEKLCTDTYGKKCCLEWDADEREFNFYEYIMAGWYPAFESIGHEAKCDFTGGGDAVFRWAGIKGGDAGPATASWPDGVSSTILTLCMLLGMLLTLPLMLYNCVSCKLIMKTITENVRASC